MFSPLQHSLKVLQFFIRVFKGVFYTTFCNAKVAKTNVKIN